MPTKKMILELRWLAGPFTRIYILVHKIRKYFIHLIIIDIFIIPGQGSSVNIINVPNFNTDFLFIRRFFKSGLVDFPHKFSSLAHANQPRLALILQHLDAPFFCIGPQPSQIFQASH